MTFRKNRIVIGSGDYRLKIWLGSDYGMGLIKDYRRYMLVHFRLDLNGNTWDFGI